MAFPHRNRARPELDLVVDAPALVDKVADNTTTPAIPGSTTSRFHITARVHITDRSLFISPGMLTFCNILIKFDRICVGRRVDLSISPSHTHRWMLSVTAPSYVRAFFSFPLSLMMYIYACVVNTSGLIHDTLDSFGGSAI
jgi:hypothetical protein